MRSPQGLIPVLVVAATLVAPPAAVSQERDWAAVEIRTERLSEGLYVLFGQGGNIGLSVGEDGAFLVDDQFAPLTEKILAAVSAVTDQPVRFVLNTHWHGDHTGGNENMGKAGALIVAHDNVRRRMDPRSFRDLVGRSVQAPPDALPVVTFNDRVGFHWNGEEIRATHVDHAHTDGDALVRFVNADVIHMGDVFFNGRYPFIDTDSGGGIEGIIAAADMVLEMAGPGTRIVPGHGDVAGPEELRAYRDMLSTVRDRVGKLIAEGRSEDEVVAAAPTKDLDATWGQNSERFVRGAYKSLQAR